MNAIRSRLPTLGAAARHVRHALAATEPLVTEGPARNFWSRACVRRAPVATYDSVFVADPIFSSHWHPVSPFMRTVMESLQSDMKLLREELSHDFDRLRSYADAKGNFFGLRARVTETDSHFKLRAELPGVPRENVKVTVNSEGALEVNAVRSEAHAAGEKNAERAETKFRSLFKLPPEVDQEAIKASVKDGVLEITLPKASPPAAQAKQIEVMGA